MDKTEKKRRETACNQNDFRMHRKNYVRWDIRNMSLTRNASQAMDEILGKTCLYLFKRRRNKEEV